MICGSVALLSFDLKGLLIARSLSNNSWFLISMFRRVEVFLCFFLLYSLTLYFILSFKNFLSKDLIVLSLSGLPPFPLFFVKVIVVYIYFTSTITYFGSLLGLFYILVALILASSYVRYYFTSFVSKRIKLVKI